MTQLARPDPARNGSPDQSLPPLEARSKPAVRWLADPGVASAESVPAIVVARVTGPPAETARAAVPAAQAWLAASARSATSSTALPAASRLTSAWVVLTAVLTPVLLIAGWLTAGAFQPASYSPMRQTMSVLAGQTGTYAWIMTTALLLVAGCQLLTGVGLTRVGAPARVLLILTGLSTLGVAASPEPATGPSARHLAFAGACVVTTAVWPLFVARRGPDRPRILSWLACGAVTILFAALDGWLLLATHSGGDLGLVERLTSGAQGIFPFFVAFALWRTERRFRRRSAAGQLPGDDVVVPVPSQRQG
jgi:hypothetical protein